MVILQFNKLIRNKWVWGVFAVAVSAAFCLDDVFRPSGGDSDSTNPLENLSLKYNPALEAECRDAIRLSSGDSDRFDNAEKLYGFYAAALAFDEAGVAISDQELGNFLNARFVPQGDTEQYKAWVHERFGMDLGRFERTWRRCLQIERGLELYAAASTWVSPMEFDQIRHDESDALTVRVATFNKDEMLAGAEVKPDALAWYSNNLARVSVPVTYAFNYVEFSAANTNLLAACQASEEEIKARYEADPQKIYFTTNATGEKVAAKELKDVSAEIADALAKEKFVDTYAKALGKRRDAANNAFTDDTSADKRATASILKPLADEYGLEVKEVKNVAISPDRNLVHGLVTSAESVFIGADTKRLKNIAPSADVFRYAVLRSNGSRRVWIVEAVAENAAQKVAFADCEAKIAPLALADKRDELFKDAVAKVIEKGADEVIAAGKAPEAVVVTSRESKGLPFAEICQLNKGDVSGLIGDKVYVCVGRNAGDYDAVVEAGRNARNIVLGQRSAFNQKKWLSSNLKRLGYERKDAPKN